MQRPIEKMPKGEKGSSVKFIQLRFSFFRGVRLLISKGKVLGS